MNTKRILLALVFIVIGAILAIYLYDIFTCLYTDSPVPLAELATFLVLLIGTTSISVALRKELRSFIRKQSQNTDFD
jgi:hypothetical protein